MSFSDKFDEIKQILETNYNVKILGEDYDAFMVKNMSESNCLNKDITSKQSHIAITGAQMDMFPYVYTKRYIEENDNNMKNFFVFTAPVNIFKSNCDAIDSGYIDFGQNSFLQEKMSIYPRSSGSQIQLSMKNQGDSKNFIKFRELIKPNDFFVVMKKRINLEYDLFIIEQNLLQNNEFNNHVEFSKKLRTDITFIDKESIKQNKVIEINYQRIYFGAPGTGKSYGIRNLIYPIYPYLDEKDNPFVFRTTIYSDYSYYNFVGSIMPVTEGNKITYDFTPGIFTEALYTALKYDENEVFLIIEEMSRGDIASIFGDIFQLLDRDENGESEYSINNDMIKNYFRGEGLEDIEKISLPRNFHIIGTVNTSDQNVNVIDTAFKRRFDYMYVDVYPVREDDGTFANLFEFDLDGKSFEWNRLYMSLNKFIITKLKLNEDKQIGQFFIKFGNYKDRESKLDAIQNKLLHYLWDDVQAATIYEDNKIFNSKYVSFSDLYKGFENRENIFNDELIDLYDNDEAINALFN